MFEKLLNEIFTCSKLYIDIASNKAHTIITENNEPATMSFINRNTLKKRWTNFNIFGALHCID